MHCFTLTTSADHIAHLVLNRPQELNTMNATFWRELGEALAEVQRAGQARVLVISSTGKHFSAGMALDVFGAGGVQMDDSSPEGRSAMGLPSDPTSLTRPPVHGVSSRETCCQS